MDNEYDYSFEEEGIGTRGCVSLIIVLLLVLLLVAGCFWWWKNYFQEEGINKSKVVVEIDDGSEYSITEDGTIVIDGEETDSDSEDFEDIELAGKEIESKLIVQETKKDAKGTNRDYSKLSKDLTEEYSSDDYIFNYAEGWTIVNPSSGFKVLTLKRKDAKLEIFQMEDFDGSRKLALDGEESADDMDLSLPKEVLRVEGGDEVYNIWLYYPAGGDEAKEDLEKVVDSFGIN